MGRSRRVVRVRRPVAVRPSIAGGLTPHAVDAVDAWLHHRATTLPPAPFSALANVALPPPPERTKTSARGAHGGDAGAGVGAALRLPASVPSGGGVSSVGGTVPAEHSTTHPLTPQAAVATPSSSKSPPPPPLESQRDRNDTASLLVHEGSAGARGSGSATTAAARDAAWSARGSPHGATSGSDGVEVDAGADVAALAAAATAAAAASSGDEGVWR